MLPGAEIERVRRNTLFGFYAQDDVTLHARLTLNLGLRYEFYTVPHETHRRDSSLRNVTSDQDFVEGPIFMNPSLKNLGPRLGVAWDVSGNGRTSVRGGLGLYYDTDGPFNTALIGATFSPPFAFPVSILNPAFPFPSFERRVEDLAAVRVGRPRRRDDLDRDVATETGIPRAIDLTHATGSEPADDLVRTNPRSRVHEVPPI